MLERLGSAFACARRTRATLSSGRICSRRFASTCAHPEQCLRCCGLVEPPRGPYGVHRIADSRVETMPELVQSPLADIGQHIAASCRIEEPPKER